MAKMILGLLFTSLLLGCDSTRDPELLSVEEPASSFRITSPNFTETRPRKRIPADNTCFGENLSPSLSWINAPQDAKSFALIAEDIDYALKVDLMGRGTSSAGEWVLWVLYNIPVGVSVLVEGIPTSTLVLPDGTTQGTNDNKEPGYFGPCPPPSVRNYLGYHGGGPVDFGVVRRYYFRLYALDQNLELEPGLTKNDLLDTIKDHILAKTEVVGKYTPPVILEEKGGAGFLSTSKRDGDKDKSTGSQGTPIYNSLGDRITATPAIGR